MSFNFRSGEPPDAVACVKIIRDWANETPWMTALDDRKPMEVYWREVFATELVWVSARNDHICGFCVRADDNISALYVAREARGCGVGKKLLDLAKENRDWITVWAYEANLNAMKFYRREGLVEISRATENYDDGVSLIDIEHRWTRPN